MAEVLEFSDIFYTNFEPKRQNLFIMEIEGIESYLVKAGSRPSLQFNVTPLDHINVKRKLKGKGEWQDITLTLYDPIVPSGAQQVMEWIRLSHESITGRDGYADFYKKDIDLFMLGPVGDKIEQWKIKGAFINSVNFGSLDWATDDVAQIEIVLSMDYCILEF